MKKHVNITKFIEYCSGVRQHAWYDSNVGIIRKPVGQIVEEVKGVEPSTWQRIKNFLKGLLRFIGL